VLPGTDIMRFRRYLGGQYQKCENSYVDSSDVELPMQIYCIYFICDGIGVKGVPVMAVNPNVLDVGTGKELKDLHNEFVDSLRHRSWIIQVPELKGRCRNDLEILLSIFDQTNKLSDCHMLNLNINRFPEEYHPIVHRLRQAIATKKVRYAMEAEDDITEHFRIEERISLFKLEQKRAALARERALLAELAALKVHSQTGEK
jgi:hypothetical protein